jgi:Concanavalin A-like lectin/glucanases superfamily
MKNTYILLLTFLLGACSVEDKAPEVIKPYFIGEKSATPIPTPNTPTNLTTGLVAYYPFNGNANDASGNNNHGIVKNLIPNQDRFNVANRAYKFADGSRIVVANSNSLKLTNAFTFSVWVNMLSTTGRNGNNAVTTESEQCIFTKNCDSGHLRCAIYPKSNGTFLLETYANEGLQSTISFQVNQWKMISIVYDGSTLKQFVDGILISSKNMTLNLTLTNTNDLVIGNMGCYVYFFNGLIDDFRMYNRALTNGEIQDLFKQ